jgi:hypothetical protein
MEIQPLENCEFWAWDNGHHPKFQSWLCVYKAHKPFLWVFKWCNTWHAVTFLTSPVVILPFFFFFNTELHDICQVNNCYKLSKWCRRGKIISLLFVNDKCKICWESGLDCIAYRESHLALLPSWVILHHTVDLYWNFHVS